MMRMTSVSTTTRNRREEYEVVSVKTSVATHTDSYWLANNNRTRTSIRHNIIATRMALMMNSEDENGDASCGRKCPT